MLGNLSKKTFGYSLIELIITITLTSIVMVIFYTVFGNTQIKSVTPVFQVKAAELGQSYLEEISLKRFDENSPIGNNLRCNDPAYLDVLGNPINCSAGVEEGVANRIDYDDVDDYNGLIDLPPKDAFGNPRSGFNSFRVNISVNFAGTEVGFPTNDVKKITVTVTTPEADQFIFSQYKGNF